MSFVGEWWNQHRSKMVLESDPRDPRHVFGTYHTNVGQAQQRNYRLEGRCAENPTATGDLVIAWVVVWDPPDPPANPADPPRQPSITAWAGQFHVVRGTEFITTTWLLTRTTSAPDDWDSTSVSMDVFFRDEPTAEMIEVARQHGRAGSVFAPAVRRG